jgi:hypothetical protein
LAVATIRAGVDHNHTTGKIRGILCNQCNLAIGMLKEDVGLLERAASYIKNDGVRYSSIPERFTPNLEYTHRRSAKKKMM